MMGKSLGLRSGELQLLPVYSAANLSNRFSSLQPTLQANIVLASVLLSLKTSLDDMQIFKVKDK
ncbi:hypothetical protein ABFT80_14610 [Mesorhizobium sp. SB112]|uniref:hypothetical protein n=1 Tax=Mesorhizobium sp. SB112 TaxID=3151853 RepID=UPI0032658E88